MLTYRLIFYKSFAANYKKGKIFGVGQNNISTIYPGFRNKKITKKYKENNYQTPYLGL